MSQKNLLYFAIYWVLYSGILIQWIVRVEALSIVSDALIFVLALTARARRKHVGDLMKYLGRVVPSLMILFLVMGIMVAIINLQPQEAILWTLREYLRYILLVYLAWITFDPEDVRKVKDILTTAMKINFGVVLFESVVLGQVSDFMGGSFSGGNASLVLLVMISIFLFAGDFFQGRLSGRDAVLYLLGYTYIAIIGEIKFLYFMIPAAIYGSYLLNQRFSLIAIAVLGVLVATFVPVMTAVLSLSYGDEYISRTLSVQGIVDETSHAEAMGELDAFNRGTAITMTQKLILKDEAHRLFGYGMGSGSVSGRFSGSIGQRWVNTKFFYFTSSTLLVEVGWIGFILYIFIHIFILWRFWLLYREVGDDPVGKYWASVGILSVGITFLLMWYNNKPLHEFHLFYLLWAVCFLGIYYRQEEIAENEDYEEVTELL